MQRIFDSIVSEACRIYLEQPEDAVQAGAQQPQQPAPAPDAAQPQDAAMAQQQPDVNQVQAGFDVYKDMVIQLMRSLATLAGAIESGDTEQMEAVKKVIPDDIVDQINQSISQISTADPAVVAQNVNTLLGRINPTPTGA
jgi:hypothetical protein